MGLPERPSVALFGIGLVERVSCDPSNVMIHYVGKGELELRDQDSGRNHNFSFKAITVERTNSLDIHKVSQRLTQYRLSTQKNNKNILDIHTSPPLPPGKNKLYYSLTTKKTRQCEMAAAVASNRCKGCQRNRAQGGAD